MKPAPGQCVLIDRFWGGRSIAQLKKILLAIAVVVTIQIMVAAAGRAPPSFWAAETGRASSDHLRMHWWASCGYLPAYCRWPVKFYASPDARNGPGRAPADCWAYAGHILRALCIEIHGDPNILVSSSTRWKSTRTGWRSLPRDWGCCNLGSTWHRLDDSTIIIFWQFIWWQIGAAGCTWEKETQVVGETLAGAPRDAWRLRRLWWRNTIVINKRLDKEDNRFW